MYQLQFWFWFHNDSFGIFEAEKLVGWGMQYPDYKIIKIIHFYQKKS